MCTYSSLIACCSAGGGDSGLSLESIVCLSIVIKFSSVEFRYRLSDDRARILGGLPLSLGSGLAGGSRTLSGGGGGDSGVCGTIAAAAAADDSSLLPLAVVFFVARNVNESDDLL